MGPVYRKISKNNATFQELQSLASNRNRRFREGRFLVEGVKPLNRLAERKWGVDALLVREGAASAWASGYADRVGPGTVYEVSPDLMAQLSGKEGDSELIAVAKAPDLDPGRLPSVETGVFVVADRPNSPGNLGSLVRSAEALGAAGVLTYGHAADFFDPKCVRASIGALFSIPLAHLDSEDDFHRWLAGLAAANAPVQVAAMDENGTMDAWQLNKAGLTVLIVGNETNGLSRAFKEACTAVVRIPMVGSSTSLNAANSGSILLYELLVRPR